MRATTRIKHIIIIILHDKDDIIGLMCQYTNNIGVRQYRVHDNNNKNNEAKNENVQTIQHTTWDTEARSCRLVIYLRFLQ